MGPGGRATLAVALFAFTALATTGSADHCRSGIDVFGRMPQGPALVPPPSPVGRVCAGVKGSLTPHELPPGSELVYARVEADLGAGYPVLPLRLEGLGFASQSYLLTRTTGVGGTVAYELGEWLPIPDAPKAEGELRAFVRFHGGYEASATYTLARNPSDVSELRLP